MDRDIFYNKKAIIERCLIRIKEIYKDDPQNLKDKLRQDAIVLNLQRACEAAIDLAMHVVSAEKLGYPNQSKDAFQFLVDGKIISDDLGESLKKMVGFRNIAIHDYQALKLEIISSIIERNLEDFNTFLKKVSEGL